MSLPLSPAGRRYGFRPSLRDPRASRPFRLVPPVPIPPTIDLEQWCGPVKDQGQEGSCTGHAGTENLEYLYRRFHSATPVFSPQFLYWEERSFDGTLDQGDCGSFGQTAVRVLAKLGCCLLSTDPYDPAHMNTPPTDAQLTEAAQYKAGAYHALDNVGQMKQCLASGYPFLLGFTVQENFEDTTASGIVGPPAGSILGGHEVLVIGYDDTRKDPDRTRKGYFKVRNSWGEGWGDHGNFYIHYDDTTQLFNEAWIQHFGPPWRP